MKSDDLVEKACPLVIRYREGYLELLAFQHPNLDKQLVKGTIDEGELPKVVAQRELFEHANIARPC